MLTPLGFFSHAAVVQVRPERDAIELVNGIAAMVIVGASVFALVANSSGPELDRNFIAAVVLSHIVCIAAHVAKRAYDSSKALAAVGNGW